MSNRKQGQPQSQPPINQPIPVALTQNQPISQVGATFAPLQLPVPVSHLSTSTQSQQNSTISQSILYRSDNNTQYSHAKAILWEIKYIISGLVSKKGVAQVTQDLQQFDQEFDKYLVRELIEQIDLKDPSKPNRDRSEPVKCILLNQELGRMCTSPNFLLFFDEISKFIFGDGHHRDFIKELASRLKLSAKMQLLIALSLYESSLADDDRLEGSKLVKQKLIEYHASGASKAELLEEYALHRLLHIFKVNNDFDTSGEGAQVAAPFDAAKKFLLEHNQVKPSQHVALRLTACDGDLINFNPTPEDPANSLVRLGSGLSHLCQVNRLIEPWEVLLDLGQSSSLNYQILSLAMQDFKEINEKTMANMLLHLAVYYQGQDDLHSRIVFGIFETNKTGDASKLKNEPSEKQTQTQWHVAHFSRAQRENYAHLKWDKVLESFTELPHDCLQPHEKFDQKAYSFFLQLFNKSKPQNVLVPISLLLETKWLNPSLQLQFIQNAINAYVTGEDKTFSFAKCSKRIGQVSELPDTNSLMIDVWSSPEVISALLNLSETQSYHAVRKILDSPIGNCPEYLLLALSQAKADKGTFLLEELLSILMRGFVESHPASSPVLKKLWDFNSELMVRSISELCSDNRANQKLNTVKALEITQGINESLIRFVKSEDYNFAVSLGILAGDRDYLNYDAWLDERIQIVGLSFVRILAYYLMGQIFRPIQDFLSKNKLTIRTGLHLDQPSQPDQDLGDDQKKIENEIAQVLEKAHLSKDRLLLTVEHLQTYLNGPEESQSAPAPNETVQRLVRFTMDAFKQIFPNHSQNQQQQEIEKIANKYFESVFKADIDVVEQRIAEFLQKMHALSQTRHQNDRDSEIFSFIVHTFFDEYRFIVSFREKKDLISFAKLFGGIINKTILDDTLLDLAVQFMIQTLQNSDARLTFGIEALKQCYQSLSDLPTHFKEIYSNYQDKIRDYDPVFHTKFVQVYNQMLQSSNKAPKQPLPENKKLGDRQDLFSSFSEGDYESAVDLKKQSAKGQDRGDSSLKTSAKPEVKPVGTNVQKQQPPVKHNVPPILINDKRKSPDQGTTIKPVRSEEVRGIPQPVIDFKQFPATVAENPFSINSAPFTSLPVQVDTKTIVAQVPEPKPIINMDAIAFNPNIVSEAAIFSPDYQSGKEMRQSAEVAAWQENIDKIISEAKKNGRTEIPIAELIEDPCLVSTLPEYQKDIRFICNNTGKETQHQRLEEANRLFAQPNPDQTLSWFLHYFLTQRLMNLQPQLPLFIEMFKKFNAKNVISKCIKTSVDILKRCMLIQEEDYYLVMRRGQATANPIKNYVQMLGQFVGLLTFAGSRPVLRTEIDLKQLLIEGFQTKNRLAVLFVCRVIKEATKDRLLIFTRKNPLIRTLLDTIKECQDFNVLGLRQGDDFMHEFSSVLKELQYVQHGQQHEHNISSVVKAHLLNQYSYPQQQVEVCYYDKKAPAIPIRTRNDNLGVSYPYVEPLVDPVDPVDPDDFLNEMRRFNNQDEIFPHVILQQATLDALQRIFYIPEGEIRRLLSEVIEQSVKEILPPVVTRSVSIALITTRELVLKDFTYDSDVQKVTGAIDQIVKNLAGSLALVTCREPLRLSLTQLLFKELKDSCFQYGSKNGLRKGDDLRQENQSSGALIEANKMDVILREFIQGNEETILQFCQDLSKDNLELGCKIVKLTVFENAVRRIQLDEEIKEAIEKRKNASSLGRPFVDETYVANFADLPEQLKPNRNGLTSQQLKVYTDFSKLNQQYVRSEITGNSQNQDQRKNQNLNAPPMQPYQQQRLSQTDHQQEFQSQDPRVAQGQNNSLSTHSFTLAQILKDLDTKETRNLSLLMRSVLTLKLQEINKQASSQQDNQQAKKVFNDSCNQIWRFIEKKFRQLYTSQNTQEESSYLIDVIALIVNKFKAQDFAMKLLNDVYFHFEEDEILLDVQLTIALLSKGIFTIKEWEKRFSFFVRDAPGNFIEKIVNFLVGFADSTVIRSLIESQSEEKQLPHLFKITQELEKSTEQDINAEMLTDQLQFVNEVFSAKTSTPNYVQLKSLFIKWVESSHIIDGEEQQRGITSFFNEFGQLVKIEQDLVKLFEFCDVMIRSSIDLAVLNQNGEQQQNNALLNYNFIDSFVKLIFTLMKICEFNKQEFMSKILDLIKSKLDFDHKKLQRSLQLQGQPGIQSYRFNQKPYFRMIMNILTAVNISDCFNQKAQRQILFDMANMMRELSPDKYPAFAFAWLEIISHRMFMSHFVKRVDPNQNQGWFILKDLLVGCFSFLKQNMVQGQQMTNAVDAFYRGTMRVVLLILKDQKDFLAQFHYNLICSLPDHAIQLKNMILSAFPENTKIMPDPFDLHLNIRLENEREPEILSNFEANLSINNLRDDLETYFKTRQEELLDHICQTMMLSVERLNGREVTSNAVINAVILYFLQRGPENQMEDAFERIMYQLDEETRLRFINATVNELRYPNSHTYQVCLILTKIYKRSDPRIKDQITRVLFERLQAHPPHPWGLLIIFREFNQNGELQFNQGDFVQNNKEVIDYLFSDRLQRFSRLIRELQPQQQS